MSLEARQELVKRLVFQRDSQRTDLLSTVLTKTELIALLLEATEHYHLEVTAVRSDHHDDSALGGHSHAYGFCADLWPLMSAEAGDYMDANDPRFGMWLEWVASSPWLYQIGLAGSADTPENRKDAGPTVFEDSGADHVHLGAI